MAIAPLVLRPLNSATHSRGGVNPNFFGSWTNQGGAANFGAALRDNSDSTYAQLAIGSTINNTYLQGLEFDTTGLTLPAGSQIRSMGGRLRWVWPNDGGEPSVTIKFGVQNPAAWGVDINYTYDVASPPVTTPGQFSTRGTINNIAGTDLANRFWYLDFVTGVNGTSLVTDGTVRIEEAYLDIYYNEPPTVTTGAGINITNLVGGAINTAQPQINWVYADPEGDTQERYKVAIWKTSDVQGTIDPFTTSNRTTWGAIFSVFYSGEVYGTATSVTVPPGLLQNGVNYRVYVAVADVGSGGRYSYAKGSYDFLPFLVSIDPVLMPTLCLRTESSLGDATASTHGGLSYTEATGQVDGMSVGARANLLTQADAAFESGAAPSLGSWVLTGGGVAVASATYPYMGIGHASITADGTGSGHIIYTSPKCVFGQEPLPGFGSPTMLNFLAHVRPVAAAGQGIVVTLRALFYDTSSNLLTSQPVTTQHTSHSANGLSYKKLWLQCPIPTAASQVAMRIDIGPCAASSVFQIDCCSITPFEFNLLENASFEQASPQMWVASTSGSNTVSFATADHGDEWAGGFYCADCNYATVSGQDYFQHADKAGGVTTIAHEGGASFLLSGSYKIASGTGSSGWLFMWDTVTDFPTRPGIPTGNVTATWQRFSTLANTSALAGTQDVRLILGANNAETAAHHLRIDDVQVEPVWSFVNGNMESGTNAVALDTTVALGLAVGAANRGWVSDSIAVGASQIYYSNTAAHAGTLSIRTDIAANTTGSQAFCQYFSVAGLSSIAGSFYTRISNAGFFYASLQQFDTGGNLLDTVALFFNGGTSLVWTPTSFNVPSDPRAAYARITFTTTGLTNAAQAAAVWVDDVTILLPLAQVYGTYIYGQPGTFGDMADDNELPGGQPLAVTPTPTYSYSAGESMWYVDALNDGQVITGVQPQTINPLQPTSDHCELDIFDPATKTWKQVIVPTSTGRSTATAPGWAVGGQEIADIGPVTIAAVFSMCWLSGGYNFGWDVAAVGLYPILGFLKKVSGVWVIDRTYTADQIYQSNPAADTAGLFTPVFGNNGIYYDAKGPAEFDVTPASNYLVIAHYFSKAGTRSGFVSVVDPATGTLKATYQFPDVTDSHGDNILFFPREVQCDPTSTAGDERFIILTDSYNGAGTGPATEAHVVIEMSFNNGNNTITPKSIPVLPEQNSASVEMGTADYDSSGNLWVTVQYGLFPRNTVVFTKSGGGTLSALAPVASFPNWQTTGAYATRVRPTLTIPAACRPSGATGLTLDSTNRVAYDTGGDGSLLAATWTAGLALGASPLAANQSTFEGGTHAFTAVFSTATLAASQTVAHAGTWSLRYTCTGPYSMVAVTNTTQAVTQGQQYRVGAWVRAGAGMTPVQAYCGVRWYNSAGTPIAVSPSKFGGLVATNRGEDWVYTFAATDSTSAWTFIYTDVDPPADAVTCDIFVFFATTATGQIHYVDDVTFQTLPFTVAWVDLSTTALRNANPSSDLALTRPVISSSYLYVPTYTKFHFDHAWSAQDAPEARPQYLYRIALTSGGSPPAQQVGPSQWLDGGWSGGGMLTTFLGFPVIGNVSLQRSTDRASWTGVRGLQTSTTKAAATAGFATFGPTFRWVWDDYEWPLVPNDDASQTFYYRASFQGTVGTQGTQLAPPGRDYTVAPTSPLTVSEWLLIDPLASANNYVLSVKTFKAETMESFGEFTPVGRNRRVVIGDTMLGDTITLEVICLTNAAFESLKGVIYQQATLMLRSPDGYSWYVRATKRSITRTWTGTYAQPLRTVSVVFTEVDPVT